MQHTQAIVGGIALLLVVAFVMSVGMQAKPATKPQQVATNSNASRTSGTVHIAPRNSSLADAIARRNGIMLNGYSATTDCKKGVYSVHSSNNVSPADFPDAHVKFDPCVMRKINLDPHPSLLPGIGVQYSGNSSLKPFALDPSASSARYIQIS